MKYGMGSARVTIFAICKASTGIVNKGGYE